MMEYILKWVLFTYFVFYVLVVLGLGTIGENLARMRSRKSTHYLYLDNLERNKMILFVLLLISIALVGVLAFTSAKL